MLANSNKSQFNSKVLSILERASSKGSDKANPALLSQRFSQSNQPKPAQPTYSQTFSSQEHSCYVSPVFDSQRYSFGQPGFSQRTFPEQMIKSSFTGYMQNTVPRASTCNTFIQDSTPDIYVNSFHKPEIEPIVTFPSQRNQKNESSYQNPFQNGTRFSFSSPMFSLNEPELSPPTTIQPSHSIAPTIVPTIFPTRTFQENNNPPPPSKPAVVPQKTSEESLIDDLGSHLLTNLNALKADLKKDIQQCSSIAEAQIAAMNKFNAFDAGLKQILETYQQFEAQLKNIEEVFLMQVERVLKAFEQNCEKIGVLQKNVTRRIGLNYQQLIGALNKFDFEPVKRSITKQFLRAKEGKRSVSVYNKQISYERVMRPFPCYSAAHNYNTRSAMVTEEVKVQGKGNKRGDEMEIEEITTKKTEMEKSRTYKKVVSFKPVVVSNQRKGNGNGNVQGNSEKRVPWRN